jgi:hypothetical protein
MKNSKSKTVPTPAFWARTALAFALMAAVATGAAAQAKVTSPEDHFGFRLGSDGNIARWDRIVDYFKLLEKESPRLKVVDMGPSTMGHPFLLVIVSSPENLAGLDRLREINARISDPRRVPASEIESLIRDGKAVICQSMSLHATEIGGTQMAPELAYDLAVRGDEETLRILDNVIFLMIPSFNPDGQIMVTDWHTRTRGTAYEGGSPPWLYHKYAGHDNNRDGDFLNLVESVYAAKIMYRDWPPQAYIDHHHMGSYGARFYVPPYGDPIRPHADPLIWREISWYGAHIAYKLEENGKSGILNAAQFPGWGHFGWHWITPFHNIAGMLTESASAKGAFPLYIHPEQLQAGARQFPDYEAQSTFPNPWPGGWWRLRDIVEQKKISAWALLDIAARNRETVLRNAYLKARRQTERGAEGKPRAYIVPMAQHDPLTAAKMINTLLQSGIEIRRARAAFTAGGVAYPEGSFLISPAQPKMGLIRNLIDRTVYPDNAWTRDRDGQPLRPYDSATHTMNEFMGVRVDPVDDDVQGDFQVLAGPVEVKGGFAPGKPAYRLDTRLNDSFKAANILLGKGVAVRRVEAELAGFRPGDFIVAGGRDDVLRDAAERTGVDFQALDALPAEGTREVKRPRIGMYHRYWGGNMDEGWTRLLLETFAFPYTSLLDADIRKGSLNARFDVVVLPSDQAALLTGDIPGSSRRFAAASYPPEFRSGLGKDGLAALQAFVEKGGTLVALREAGHVVIDRFGLSVRNTVAGLGTKEFFCPGSTIRAVFDTRHPLAWGMPEDGLILSWNGPAFEVLPGPDNERYRTVVRYADRGLLGSGWLIGEQHLAGKPAMIEAEHGRGRVVLIGFPAQHRSQTHGTFKLLFNALMR